MVSFIGLPQLRAPDNMGVDLRPIGNALGAYFKGETLRRGTASLADALGGNALSAPSAASPMQGTRSNALSSTLSGGGMGPPDAMGYGVAGGAKNAMFDMGNLNTQQPTGLDRSQFKAELQDPNTRTKLLALTHAEVGNQGPDARQAFLETVINRAQARNQPLSAVIHDQQYFPAITHQRAARGIDPQTAQEYAPILDNVLNGSNVAHYATGNASGTVGFNGGPQTAAYGGERFGVEGPDRNWATKAGLGGQSDSPTKTVWSAASQAPANSSPQAQQPAPQPYRTADASGGIDPRILNWVKENPAHPAAQEILGKILEQRTDPMIGLRTQQAQANLKGTLSEQDRAGVEHFGKISAAIDELPPGPQRDGAWQSVITRHNAQHPGEHLTQQELDPITGPKLMAAQAGNLAAPDKFTTVGHDAFGSPSYGFVNDRTQEITLAKVPGQQSTALGADPHITGEDFLKTIDKPIADQVRAIAEGRMPIPGGFALKTPYWQKMMQNVAQYDPSFDAINYNARAATRKDFTSGKSAQNITSFNTAIGHLDSLDKSIAGLGNGNYPLLNEYLINPVKSQISPEYQIGVQKFQTSRLAVAEELARAFKGTGGSLSEVEHWNGLIGSAKTPDQLHAAVKQAVDLLESRINAVGEGYRRGMGSTADVKDLLNPKARAALQRLSGDAASSDTGDAPVRVSNPDEALKLAPGTVFMTPDGRTKVRP